MNQDRFNALLKAAGEEGRCHYLHPNGKFCRYTEIVHDGTELDDHSYVSLADLLREVAGPQWQPIETAPRDGTQVLFSDGEWVFTGRYDGNSTHWMPMPEPPTPERKEEKP